MTGPEHYRQAERLLSSATEQPQFEDGSSPWASRTLAFAQVHATLALAAATAINDYPDGSPLDDVMAWREVAGVKPATEIPSP